MKNPSNAIEVSNVRKYFKVYYDRGITIKDRFLSRGRSRYEKREVLKGITFDVKKGEALGLIGKNGCGKSTTLKLLTRIIYPNEGTVELSGRVSSLLELGAGFHPDMSGRENIYMNAAVFGLTKREIDVRVEDIIRFSELEEFMDNPVRTYSSGMYMRLAFSVAINVDADILLIDEILAVGDISFQKKCFEKLKEIKAKGTTIVIVSHSLDQIEKICDRSIWIKDGVVIEDGRPVEVNKHYLCDMEKERLEHFQEEVYANMKPDASATPGSPAIVQQGDASGQIDKEALDVEDHNLADTNAVGLNYATTLKGQILSLKKNFLKGGKQDVKHSGSQEVWFSEMYITDMSGREKVFFETGESINIYLKYDAKEAELKGTLCLLVYRDDGVYCFGTNTFIEHMEIKSLRNEGYLKIELKEIPLLPAKYYFSIGIHDEHAEIYDLVERAACFQVFSDKGDLGITRICSDWIME